MDVGFEAALSRDDLLGVLDERKEALLFRRGCPRDDALTRQYQRIPLLRAADDKLLREQSAVILAVSDFPPSASRRGPQAPCTPPRCR